MSRWPTLERSLPGIIGWGLFCGLLWTDGLLWAQSYHAVTYGEEAGLASSEVLGIAQDAGGRMWFATRAGITCYDGAFWQNYTVADGLPFGVFDEIRIDSRGWVWAFSRFGDHIIVFKDDAWHVLPEIPGFGTPGTQPITIELWPTPQEKRLPEHRLPEHRLAVCLRKRVYVWEQETWRPLAVAEKLADAPFYEMKLWNGKLFLATGPGLATVEDGTVRPYQLVNEEALPGIIADLAPEAENAKGFSPRLWVRGDRWLGFLQEDRFHLLSQEIDPLTDPLEPNVLWPDPKSPLIFYGKKARALYFDRTQGRERVLGAEQGLAAPGMTAIFRDRETNLWVAGYRGITKFPSFRFENYHRADGLLEDEVASVEEIAPDYYVFGHEQGLTLMEEGRLQHFSFQPEMLAGQPSTRVMDLILDRGWLWLAASRLGVGRWKPGDEIRWYAEDAGFRGSAYTLVSDGKGGLWVMGNEGLFHLVAGKFEFLPNPSLESQFLRHGARDREGNLYVVSPKEGCWKYNGSEWLPIRGETPKPLNLYCVLVDSLDRVWVGSGRGLMRLTGHSLKMADLGGSRVEDAVYLLFEGPHATLWAGLNNGVARWDGKKLRTFTLNDGLAGRETNRGAGLVDTRGDVWVGFDRGVSRYQKAFDFEEIPPPIVSLDTVAAGDRVLSLDTDQILNYSERNLFFNYHCISFINEHDNAFRSQLEGFEKEWSSEYRLQGKQSRYTNLPPGRYRLRVMARNALGNWSEPVSSGWIRIQPPVWLQPWFAVFTVLLFFGMVYGAVSFLATKRYSLRLKAQVNDKTQELVEKNALLNRELIERENIGKELRLAKEAAERARETAESANRAKSEFLATMSHEIRTPLNGVIATTSMLLAGQLKAREQELAKIIKVSGETLLAIIDDILDFSKIESAMLELESTPFEIRELVIETVGILKPTAEKKGLKLKCSVAEHVPRAVIGDRVRVRQVLLNLLSNAVKFTRSGWVSLSVAPDAETTRSGTERETPPLLMAVEDSGIGIPPEKLHRLFNPFTQVDSSTNRRYGGTGLGLAICKRLVELMNGKIWVESQLNAGSTFFISIPLQTAELVEKTPNESSAEIRSDMDDNILSDLRILVAEDNPVNQKILVYMLNTLGVTPDCAKNGVEAVASAEQSEYDLIFMDVFMPEMDGIEATRRILSRSGKRPTIIACTANALKEDRKTFQQAGMKDILIKPIDLDQLKAMILRCWGKNFSESRSREAPP